MEYKLRRKAWELSPVMLALHVWSQNWADDDSESEVDFVDIFNSEPLAKAELRSQEGRILAPGDVRVIPKTKNAKEYLDRYKSKPSRTEVSRSNQPETDEQAA